MNESIKNMIERRSVRGYKSDMIPKEDLDLILEAGTYAATGMGMQSPVIVAVRDKDTRDQLSKMNAALWEPIRIRSTEHLLFWWYWPIRTDRHVYMTEALSWAI